MNEVLLENFIFVGPYVAFFAIACAAGLSRSVRDDDMPSLIRLLSAGSCSGFLAISIICICLPGDYQRSFVSVGIASLCGLAGQEVSEALASKLLRIWVGKNDGSES